MTNVAYTLGLEVPAHIKTWQSLRPQWAQDVEEKLRALLTIAQSFDQGFTEISDNPDLTPQGQHKGLLSLVTKTLGLVTRWIEAAILPLDNRIKGLADVVLRRGAIARPTDPAERIAYELRLAEIRASARALPPTERLAAYLATSDPMVIDAFESAPPIVESFGGKRPFVAPEFRPLVDPDRKLTMVLERARTSDPATAEELELMRELRHLYAITVTGLRKQVLAAVPASHEPMEDPALTTTSGDVLER
ncbi:MAG: hypothetical protein HY317_03180 [Acidobacteria bacterium]|nr:hypothetical protein [Acidobacteriota bacterium]